MDQGVMVMRKDVAALIKAAREAATELENLQKLQSDGFYIHDPGDLARPLWDAIRAIEEADTIIEESKVAVTTKIPGVKALHAVISDDCRTGRGDEGAIDEALARIKAEYTGLLERWPIGKGAKLHVAMTVEYGDRWRSFKTRVEDGKLRMDSDQKEARTQEAVGNEHQKE